MVRFAVTHSVGEADGVEVWPVYEAIFGDHSDYQTWRESVWDKHAARDGYRLARAYQDDGLVGFAYGYTGEDGQWWTDNARRALRPEIGEAWLGGHFEVVSLGVLSAARWRGVGRTLLRLLVHDLPHDRLLLMTTADPTDPARQLYGSEGWHVLGPGTREDAVIMGKQVRRDEAG